MLHRRRDVGPRRLQVLGAGQLDELSGRLTLMSNGRPLTPLDVAKSDFRKRRKIRRKRALSGFPGRIYVESHEYATCRAQAEQEPPEKDRLVFWTDASFSRPKSALASAVTYQRDDVSGWIHKSVAIRHDGAQAAVQDAELIAIDAALQMGADEASQRSLSLNKAEWVSSVIIYSDSSTDLDHIRAWEPYALTATHTREPILRNIFKASRQLIAMGIRVELRWVPGHSGVFGNELADVTARLAAHQLRDLRIESNETVSCHSEASALLSKAMEKTLPKPWLEHSLAEGLSPLLGGRVSTKQIQSLLKTTSDVPNRDGNYHRSASLDPCLGAQLAAILD